jgi:transposase
MPGNTSDKTTLADFLKKIEDQYGKSERVWVMDRGIPTEATLEQMRRSDPPVCYLVGTPKGKLTVLEKAFLAKPWQTAREAVHVKLLPQEQELYVLAKSDKRVHKERAMRTRKLKKLWKRLHQLQAQKLTRDQLLIKLGAAKKEAGRVYSVVKIRLPKDEADLKENGFGFSLRKDKLRQVRRREGRYLLRSNLTQTDPARLWQYYVQLTEIEQAFKELKSDLCIRPIYHQRDARIEAHIFVAFVAYCLQVTLKQRSTRALAPGLSPAAVLEKFAALQMVDVHLPTTDGRHLVLPRYTQPEKDLQLLLKQLKLQLPSQPPPRIQPSAEQKS